VTLVNRAETHTTMGALLKGLLRDEEYRPSITSGFQGKKIIKNFCGAPAEAGRDGYLFEETHGELTHTTYRG
jgi:hypothetical protein